MPVKMLSILLLCVLISACARPEPIDTFNLQQLKRLSANTVRRAEGNVNEFRVEMLKETALSVGARSGLAWRSQQINVLLERQRKVLDRAFNFGGMMLAHNISPPVLVEGRGDTHLASGDTIRLADRSYKILQQAQFTTVPPNWRTYIWMDFTKPEPPNRSILPKTTAENRIWAYYIEQGWKQGVVQADSIFTDNLNRLRRDYQGMLLYRQLLSQNMVSAPFVAKTELGVTNENGELRVNDQVLRITALPTLQANPNVWNPVMTNNWRAPTIDLPTDATNVSHE